MQTRNGKRRINFFGAISTRLYVFERVWEGLVLTQKTGMGWRDVKVSERCAMGYVGKSEDVASLVSYLVSKEAHYITGKHMYMMTRNILLI